VGKITALREAPAGRVDLHLDNQQVWMQAEPQPSIKFEVARRCTSSTARWIVWLSADKGRKTRSSASADAGAPRVRIR